MSVTVLDPWLDPDDYAAVWAGAGDSLPRDTGPRVPAPATTLPATGRRPVGAPVNSGRMGWCYLFHLTEPIGAGRPRVAQAQHYLGWARRGRLVTRARDDLAGRGCRLLAYAAELNIDAELVRIWKGDRNRERQLKQRAATRYCPVCTGSARIISACQRDRYLTRVVNQLRER